MASPTRHAESQVETDRALRKRREDRCGHIWRYPQVGGPPQRVCRLCKRREWLDSLGSKE